MSETKEVETGTPEVQRNMEVRIMDSGKDGLVFLKLFVTVTAKITVDGQVVTREWTDVAEIAATLQEDYVIVRRVCLRDCIRKEFSKKMTYEELAEWLEEMGKKMAERLEKRHIHMFTTTQKLAERIRKRGLPVEVHI
ncbi:MAG: hypothetical protein ACP5I3_11505 [Thermoproteus sp.]